MKFSPVRRWLPRVILCVFGIGIGMVVGIGALQAARVTYQYDDAGRLKRVIYPDHATKDYALDPAGNRTNVQAAVPTGGVLSFATAEYSFSEGVGTAQLSVTRIGNTADEVRVNYRTETRSIEGYASAAAGSDYAAASGQLVWAAGEANSQAISIVIVDDAVPESTEAFVVILESPTGGAVLGETTQATVSIADNDNPTFSIANQSIGENTETLNLTVSLLPSSPLTYQVSYATANGSATAGSDYTATSGTLTFGPNVTSQLISIPILPDERYEGDETFTVTLSNPTGGAGPGTLTATMTIQDDDAAPTFAIEDTNASNYEHLGPILFTIRMTGVSDLTHTVSYRTVGFTATEGVDYVAVNSTVSFAPNTPNFRIVAVSPTDDATYEGDEQFYVDLIGVTGGASIPLATSRGVGTIIENDPMPPRGTLQFAYESSSAWEHDPYIDIMVSRINGSFGAASVTCTTSNINAAAGSDYTHTNTVLSWSDGDTASKACRIPILQDSIEEATCGVIPEVNEPYCFPWESFRVTLSGASGASLAMPTVHEVSIMDDDDNTPPSAPYSVYAAFASLTQVNLTWGPSYDANPVSGYRIYRDGSLYGTSTTTSFVDTGVVNGQVHSYAVAGYDQSGNQSSLSSPASPAPTIPPSAPTGVIANPASHAQVNISWNASTAYSGKTVIGYQVYRNGSLLVMMTGALSYNDTSVAPSTSYNYTVAAMDSASLWSIQSSPPAWTTTPAAPPEAPATPQWSGSWSTCTEPSGCVTNNDFTLSWSIVPGATWYEVEHSNDINQVLGVYQRSDTSFYQSWLSRAGYPLADIYRVRACSANGCSPYSPKLKFGWEEIIIICGPFEC